MAEAAHGELRAASYRDPEADDPDAFCPRCLLERDDPAPFAKGDLHTPTVDSARIEDMAGVFDAQVPVVAYRCADHGLECVAAQSALDSHRDGWLGVRIDLDTGTGVTGVVPETALSERPVDDSEDGQDGSVVRDDRAEDLNAAAVIPLGENSQFRPCKQCDATATVYVFRPDGDQPSAFLCDDCAE